MYSSQSYLLVFMCCLAPIQCVRYSFTALLYRTCNFFLFLMLVELKLLQGHLQIYILLFEIVHFLFYSVRATEVILVLKCLTLLIYQKPGHIRKIRFKIRWLLK